jgi:Uncharacterised nucleotidyltransferase
MILFAQRASSPFRVDSKRMTATHSTPRAKSMATRPLFVALLLGETAALDRLIPSATDTDWATALADAETQSVAALLSRAATALGIIPPERFWIEFQRRVAALRLVQRALAQDFAWLCRLFDDTGLTVVALKGPALAERLYGDATFRASVDLDFLLDEHDLARALELLAVQGYVERTGPSARYDRRYEQTVTLDHSQRSTIELHYSLLADFRVLLPASPFLARSIAYRLASGGFCRVLAAEDEALYLPLHAAHHLCDRFGMMYDVRSLLAAHPDLNWDAVIRNSAEWRVREALTFALEVTSERVGLDGPPRIGRRVRIASRLLALHDQAPRGQPIRTFWSLLTKAALCDSRTSAAAYLGHGFSRIVRRRLQRRMPRLVPSEWSA